MQQLIVNELADGDLVIYEDLDVEYKHNTSKLHTAPTMIADKRLPYGTQLKEMTHSVTNNTTNKEFKCFIVRTTDEDYNYWNFMTQCTAYGKDNKPMEEL